MIFIAFACVKDSFVWMEDNFKWCKYTKLDYTAHQIAAVLSFFLCCYQSVEHMLLVKTQIKTQPEASYFSPGGDKNRELL